MAAPPVRVTITKDTVSRVIGAITDMVGQQVLVGVPEKTTERADEKGEPVNNATLAYIHEYGSPAANIPARPFLIPGVEAAEKTALGQLRLAVDAALKFKTEEVTQRLEKAGIVASTSVKDKIMSGPFEPLKPATVRARRYSRSTQSVRAAEQQYMDLVRSGVSPADAQDAAGIRPLINTGALRDSITYVVRKRGWNT